MSIYSVLNGITKNSTEFLSASNSFSDFLNSSSVTQNYVQENPERFRYKNIRRIVRRSKFIPFIIVGLFVIVLTGLFIRNISFNNNIGTSPVVAAKEDARMKMDNPYAVFDINKEFKFPLLDNSGKELSKIAFIIQNAELRKDILVAGEKASAINGKTFLIINIKVINNYKQSVQLNVRDYLRLIINNSSENLAPEIHNDPVEVQAISTKYTRVAFPIDQDFKKLILQVGEIIGDKDKIDLNFKKN